MLMLYVTVLRLSFEIRAMGVFQAAGSRRKRKKTYSSVFALSRTPTANFWSLFHVKSLLAKPCPFQCIWNPRFRLPFFCPAVLAGKPTGILTIIVSRGARFTTWQKSAPIAPTLAQTTPPARSRCLRRKRWKLQITRSQPPMARRRIR
jgi:hypothetical protein